MGSASIARPPPGTRRNFPSVGPMLNRVTASIAATSALTALRSHSFQATTNARNLTATVPGGIPGSTSATTQSPGKDRRWSRNRRRFGDEKSASRARRNAWDREHANLSRRCGVLSRYWKNENTHIAAAQDGGNERNSRRSDSNCFTDRSNEPVVFVSTSECGLPLRSRACLTSNWRRRIILIRCWRLSSRAAIRPTLFAGSARNALSSAQYSHVHSTSEGRVQSVCGCGRLAVADSSCWRTEASQDASCG